VNATPAHERVSTIFDLEAAVKATRLTASVLRCEVTLRCVSKRLVERGHSNDDLSPPYAGTTDIRMNNELAEAGSGRGLS
jgi:hypothetical protein